MAKSLLANHYIQMTNMCSHKEPEKQLLGNGFYFCTRIYLQILYPSFPAFRGTISPY